MDQSLTGKVVAITGAASGIGLACARRCLAAGATRRARRPREDQPRALGAELGDRAPRPRRRPDRPGERRHACCPGSSSAPASSTSSTPTPAPTSAATCSTATPDAWDRMLALNVNAVFRTVRAVLPHMVERGTGDIVVTSSVAGHIPVSGSRSTPPPSTRCRPSSTPSAARSPSTASASMEVSPGPVVTALLKDWPKENLDKALAAGSLIEPEEVAEAVHFMLTRPRNVTIRDLVILPQSQDI